MATSVFAPASSLHQYAGLGPFWHRGKDIIWGKREVNGYNLIQSDVFCPEASEWEWFVVPIPSQRCLERSIRIIVVEIWGIVAQPVIV